MFHVDSRLFADFAFNSLFFCYLLCLLSYAVCRIYETCVNVLIHGLFSHCCFFLVCWARRCVYFFFHRFMLLSVPLFCRQLQLRTFEFVFRNLFIGFGRLAFLFFNIHFLICLPVWQTAHDDNCLQPKHSKCPFKIWIWIICLFIALLSVYGTNLHLSVFKRLIKYRRCSIKLCSVLCTKQVFKHCLSRLLNWIQRPHLHAKCLQISTKIPNTLWRGAEIGLLPDFR